MNPLVTKQNSISTPEGSTIIQCSRCGWPVSTDRDSRCPLCDRENPKDPMPERE